MNYLTEMMGLHGSGQQQGNALAADVERAKRLQQLIDQGMTPEAAEHSMAKMDALRAASQREVPKSGFSLRTPNKIIGVRG